MQLLTTSLVLVSAASVFASQGDSGVKSDAPAAEKPRAVSVLLTKGKRPANPGGKLYRENWGGFWGRVSSVAFSPDGRYLLSSGSDSNDGTVRLWDVQTGEELRRYKGKGHSSQYGSVAFSPDGKLVLAGSYKYTGSDPHAAWLWDIDTTSEVQRYVGRTTHFVGGVNVAYSPDGRSIVTARTDGPAILWDAAAGVAVRHLGGGSVQSAAFSPNGKWIVTGAGCGYIAIWDATSGKEKHGFRIDGSARSVEFSPDGQFLLVLSWNDVYYVDAWNGELIHRFSFVFAIHAATLSPDGSHVLIGVSPPEYGNVSPCGHGCAELYDLSTGKRVRTFEENQGYDGWISAAGFSRDGRFLATGSLHGPIRLWDVATGEQVRAFYGHLGDGPPVSFIGDVGVIIGSWMGSLDEVDESQRLWLDGVRRRQKLTVGGSK